MKRYSKKRQSIIDFLSNTKEHPSAIEVYNSMRNKYPNISLGTVYRNLNELKESGEISSVAFVHGKERFDYNAMPHTHIICEKCGKIIDLDEIKVPSELSEKTKTVSGFEIKTAKLQFVGLCKECLSKKDQ